MSGTKPRSDELKDELEFKAQPSARDSPILEKRLLYQGEVPRPGGKTCCSPSSHHCRAAWGPSAFKSAQRAVPGEEPPPDSGRATIHAPPSTSVSARKTRAWPNWSGKAVGRPCRPTLKRAQRVQEFRGQDLPWWKVAQLVGLPVGTCRRTSTVLLGGPGRPDALPTPGNGFQSSCPQADFQAVRGGRTRYGINRRVNTLSPL